MSAIQQLGNDGAPLKRVGLIVAAILAGVALVGMTAFTASARAQVGIFVEGEESEEEPPRLAAEEYPVDLEGQSTSTQKYTFGEYGGELYWQCPSVEFSSTESLSSATADLSFYSYYPVFSCESSMGYMPISANGCSHTLTIDNAGPPYTGKFGFDCPEGQAYELHAVEVGCDIKIPEQEGSATVNLENVGEGSEAGVDVEFDVSGLSYEIDGIFLCPKGQYEDGTYTGTMTLTGE